MEIVKLLIEIDKNTILLEEEEICVLFLIEVVKIFLQ
jgi:hypothetical protein